MRHFDKCGKISDDDNYIPITERDTECDRCQHLQKCIDNGNVLESTWDFRKMQHYIKGRGCQCLKDSGQSFEMKFD